MCSCSTLNSLTLSLAYDVDHSAFSCLVLSHSTFSCSTFSRWISYCTCINIRDISIAKKFQTEIYRYTKNPVLVLRNVLCSFSQLEHILVNKTIQVYCVAKSSSFIKPQRSCALSFDIRIRLSILQKFHSAILGLGFSKGKSGILLFQI